MNRTLKALIAGILISSIAFVFYKQVSHKQNRFTNIINKKKSATIWSQTYELVPAQQENDPRLLKGLLQNDSIILDQRLKSTYLDATIKIDDKQITLTIPSIIDTANLGDLFTTNKTIGFWEMYTEFEVMAALNKINELQNPQKANIKKPDTELPPDTSENGLGKLTVEPGKEKENEKAIKPVFIFSDALDKILIAYVQIRDTTRAGQIMRDPVVTTLLPANAAFLFGSPVIQNKISLIPVYALKNHGINWIPPVGDADIKSVKADLTYNDIPEVNIEFTHGGARKWAKLTNDNINRYLAITMNDLVISAPIVNSPILSGNASISGGFEKFLDASILAAQLKSGQLPMALSVKSRKIELNRSHSKFWMDMLVFAGLVLLLTGLSYFIIKKLETR